jgi:outer membrane protein
MNDNMISKFTGLVLLLVSLASFPIQAQAEKLAYVDARRLIDEAPQGKDEIKILEENFSERNRELKGKIEQYNAQEAELQKNAVLLPADELQQKSNELRELQRSLQREQQNYNEDYARNRNQGLARLEKLISEVIIELAIQEKIDLVVQQAVYASPEIDFTDRVLEELKSRYK